jgi:uncharacterized OB-fold protein
VTTRPVTTRPVTTRPMTTRPVAEPTALGQAYQQALVDGRLIFQRCSVCRNAWLPPRDECPRCLADQWAWEEASGRATLVSWVTYHTAYHPFFADKLPYLVAVIELEEGPRLISNLVGTDEVAPSMDQAVQAEFHHEAEQSLVLFRSREPGTGPR